MVEQVEEVEVIKQVHEEKDQEELEEEVLGEDQLHQQMEIQEQLILVVVEVPHQTMMHPQIN